MVLALAGDSTTTSFIGRSIVLHACTRRVVRPASRRQAQSADEAHPAAGVTLEPPAQFQFEQDCLDDGRCEAGLAEHFIDRRRRWAEPVENGEALALGVCGSRRRSFLIHALSGPAAEGDAA